MARSFSRLSADSSTLSRLLLSVAVACTLTCAYLAYQVSAINSEFNRNRAEYEERWSARINAPLHEGVVGMTLLLEKGSKELEFARTNDPKTRSEIDKIQQKLDQLEHEGADRTAMKDAGMKDIERLEQQRRLLEQNRTQLLFGSYGTGAAALIGLGLFALRLVKATTRPATEA